MTVYRSIGEWLTLEGFTQLGFLTDRERRNVDRGLLGLSIATSAVGSRAIYGLTAQMHNWAIARGMVQPFSEVYAGLPSSEVGYPKSKFKLAGLGKPSARYTRGGPRFGGPMSAHMLVWPSMLSVESFFSVRADPRLG